MIKSVGVIGDKGFLGTAVVAELHSRGVETTSYPSKDNEILINLSGPTHLQFEESPSFYTRNTVDTVLSLMDFCEKYNIRYVWPSSALVYEPKDSPFVHVKRAIEDLQYAYNVRPLCLRVFPVYGVGEGNKGKFKTVIYQWCEQVLRGESPIIYGDGSQKRDFIYIEDAARQIVDWAFSSECGFRNVGAGKPVSFNEVITEIVGATGKKVNPQYVDIPKDYPVGIICQNPPKTTISLSDGIKRIIKHISNE